MDNIKQILTDETTHGKSPSVQYYHFDDNKIIKSFKSGFADIASHRKVDEGTEYHAFSVTKTFTAIAILQLAELGQLDIDHEVIRYLPGFQYGKGITVKQLLNHTAGIPNPVPLSWIHLDTEHASFNRNAFFKSVVDKHNKVNCNPNEKFAYSNLGYVILGQLIEKVSGMYYEDYITNNILARLSIENDLGFKLKTSEIQATGYHKKWSFSNFLLGFFIDKSKFMDVAQGKWRPFKPFYVNGTSYGGLIGKPVAFVLYIQELLRTENKLISGKSRELLFTVNNDSRGRDTKMALSWFSGELNGAQYFTHAGGGGGYYCELRIYPKLSRGSVIFFNRSGLKDERYLDKLDRFYIGMKG